MVDYYYPLKGHKMYWSPKETAYRTSGEGKDKTNLNNDTFYPFPMELHRVSMFMWVKNKRVEYTAATGPDEGSVLNAGYKDFYITMSGPMHNFDQLYFACKGCTTAGADPYTHTYATSTARASTVPSFQILDVFENPASEDIVRLMVGVTVVKWEISWSASGHVYLSMTYHIAKVIAGTALTSYPTANSSIYQTKDVSVPTYTKGGVAYKTKVKGFKISWTDNVKGDIGASDAGIPSSAIYGARKIRVTVDQMFQETDPIDDFDDDPTSAHDKDLVIELERTDASDEITFTFAKITEEGIGDGEWLDWHLKHSITYLLNPTETGKLLTIAQDDSNTNARFEGA